MRCHNETVTALSHATSMAVVPKILAKIMQDQGGLSVLRPARADQPEHIGFEALKRQALKWSFQTAGE